MCDTALGLLGETVDFKIPKSLHAPFKEESVGLWERMYMLQRSELVYQALPNDKNVPLEDLALLCVLQVPWIIMLWAG